MAFNVKQKRRFLIACLIPFLCMFAITLAQTNAIFALDGMINHTAVDQKLWEKSTNRQHVPRIDHRDTCLDVTQFQYYYVLNKTKYLKKKKKY